MSSKRQKNRAVSGPARASHPVPQIRGFGQNLNVLGLRSLEIGVVVGAFGVPCAVWLGLRNPFGPPKVLVLALGAALVLLGLALDPTNLADAAQAVRRSRLSWALGAVVAVAALATITAIDPRQGLLGGYPDYRGFLSIVAYSVIGLGALVIWRAASGPKWVGRCAIAAGVCVGGLGVLQRIGVVPAGARGDFGTAWFVSSTLGNSSNLGVFLVVLLPLVVWAALRDELLAVRVVGWAAASLGILSLVWTLSRGAWVAGITSLAVVAAVVAWRTSADKGLKGSWRIAVIVAVLIVGALLTPTFARRAAVLVDPGSTTASWRLSTWHSAVDMTLARPFLGYGPNNFHLAYPAFQARGQVDGRRGYPIVEAAHNLELDTATSFGIPGLLLLVLAGGLACVIVVSAVRTGESEPGLPIALGLALLGGVVSLQFHYVTMDTGPLLALVLAGIVAVEPAMASREAAPVAVGALEAFRWAAGVGAIVYIAISIAGLGLVVADAAEQKAVTLARHKAPWATIRSELSRAEALAPWETQIVRARGTVATQVVTQHFDPAAAADGMRAFDTAVAATPADAVLAAERANLLLAAGAGSKDAALLSEAAGAFEAAQRMDPNTGVSLAGQAAALLALGRTADAIEMYRQSVLLSPRYAPAWRNLARAYAAVGRTRDARLATERANRWSQ